MSEAIEKLRRAFDECTVMAGGKDGFECVFITKSSVVPMLDAIEAENKKLRELVTDAHACKENDGCCEDCYMDEGDCLIKRRMRELGIEVKW